METIDRILEVGEVMGRKWRCQIRGPEYTHASTAVATDRRVLIASDYGNMGPIQIPYGEIKTIGIPCGGISRPARDVVVIDKDVRITTLSGQIYNLRSIGDQEHAKPLVDYIRARLPRAI